jgi:signal transduction histidine kinase
MMAPQSERTADREPERGAPASASAAGLTDVLREYMEVTGRLQHTHQMLQHEVTRLREELASKDRELELRRRLAALGEMAAGVAHEVRNPLGAIQLYSGLLRTQCSGAGLEPALDLIEKIDAGIQAIEAVVQDTLALAPRDRGLSRCRLQTIVERARDATLKTLTVCGVHLETQSTDTDLCVRADADGLQRVVVNLIVNAAEASPQGRTVRVTVGAVAGGEAELRVRDEGCGLPEEILHRIFDPFFTTKQQGTGLGLTIAHRLVEAYGGRLRAANRPEGGAEFVITLPRAEAGEAGAEVENRKSSAA